MACDLCGAAGERLLRTPPAMRAMRSDRHIVPTRLEKAECQVCGLVFDTNAGVHDPEYYAHEYALDAADHVFFSASGPRRRSAVLADWIERLLRQENIDPAGKRVLEVGASRGFLLTELAARWPDATLMGVELSVEAAAEASRRGAKVVAGSTASLPSASQDLVLAIAVLEHVPSPTSFLDELRRVLSPEGHLILIQPTQDVPSYDIFFVDHLFHFGTPHVRAFGSKTGFRLLRADVGFNFMPNFSGHLFAASAPSAGPAWRGAPATTTCESTMATVVADLARLERDAGRLRQAGTPLGVFGLHEVFALVRAYSHLDEIGIAVGLADDADAEEYQALGIPVVRPEACAAFGVRDIFLTMNRVHYPFAVERLGALGLAAIPGTQRGDIMTGPLHASAMGWISTALHELSSEGYVVIEGVLDGAFLSKCRESMYRAQAAIRRDVGQARLERARELGVLRLMMKYEPFFFSFLELPELLVMVDHTVSAAAVLHLQNGLILPSVPGEAPRVFQNSYHQDFPRLLNGYLASINMFFAIDEFTVDNGATLVVPGTHQQTRPADADIDARAIPLTCPAGAMIVFDSTLWHAAGINTSGRDRLAINHQFTRSYIKQQIDYVRALGDVVVQALPPRSQQLLGWYTRVVTSLDEYYQPPESRLYRSGQG